VVLVTDRLHMLRASRVFGARGYDVERAGVPVYATHHGNLDMLWGGLREYAALVHYRVNGWFASPDRMEPGHQPGSTGTPAPVSPRFPDGPIVILGASYAAGWNPTTLAGRPVINKGVTGQQSFELAERFDADVVSASPRAVIVWGFINDVFRAPVSDVEAALARARSSITRMIERGRAEGVEVILATEVTITGRDSLMERLASFVGPLLGKTSHQDRINLHVTDTNKWIRDTARGEGLLLLDFEKIVSGPDGRRRRDFAQEDGSHLTPLAYEVLTNYAQPLVSRHMDRR
jgi:lysophospholipase L1-like esterase